MKNTSSGLGGRSGPWIARRRSEGEEVEEAVVVAEASRQVDVDHDLSAVVLMSSKCYRGGESKEKREGLLVAWLQGDRFLFFMGCWARTKAKERGIYLFVMLVGCGKRREIEKERGYSRWRLRIEGNRGRRQ